MRFKSGKQQVWETTSCEERIDDKHSRSSVSVVGTIRTITNRTLSGRYRGQRRTLAKDVWIIVIYQYLVPFDSRVRVEGAVRSYERQDQDTT